MSASEAETPLGPEEAEEFFSLLRDKCGTDHKKLSKSYTDVHKFAWEQVLTLAIYSRQFCYNESFNSSMSDAQGRMLLIDLAYKICSDHNPRKNQPVDFSLVHFVLKMLDDGMGIVEVIQTLSKDDSPALEAKEDAKQTNGQEAPGDEGEKSELSALKYRLLSCIQAEHVTFRPYVSHPMLKLNQPSRPMYNHGMLHTALVSSVEMFQPLLVIEDLSEAHIFFDKFMDSLKNSIFSRFTISHSFNNREKLEHHREIRKKCESVLTLEDLKTFLNEFPEVIESSFPGDFKSMLMKDLADAINAAFDVARHWEPEQKGRFNRSVFANVCRDVRPSYGKLALELDLVNLKNIHELGFLDEVVASLRERLLEHIGYGEQRGRSHRIAIPVESYGIALDELSLWCDKRGKKRLFNKLHDVPSLIAAVLYSDFRYEQGTFCPKFYPKSPLLPEKLSVDDAALFVTYLIHHCLYKQLPFGVFVNMTLYSGELSRPKISKQDDLETALGKVSGYLGEHQTISFDEQTFSPNRLWPNETLMEKWKDVDVSPEGKSKARERVKKIPSYLKPIKTEGKGSRRILNSSESILAQRKAVAECQHKYPIDIDLRLPLWASMKDELKTKE